MFTYDDERYPYLIIEKALLVALRAGKIHADEFRSAMIILDGHMQKIDIQEQMDVGMSGLSLVQQIGRKK